MKRSIAILTVMLVCFTAVYAGGSGGNSSSSTSSASVPASLTADVMTVTEGGNITLDLTLDTDLEIEGATLIFDFPEDIIDTITLPEEVTADFNFDTGILSLEAPKQFGPGDVVLSLDLLLKDIVLAAGEESRDYTFSINAESKVVSQSQEYLLIGTSGTVTVTPAYVTASAALYSELTDTSGITARLYNGADSIPVAIDGITDDEIILEPFRKVLLVSGGYTLEFAGEGFVTATLPGSALTSDVVAVKGFYPGDVNADGKINFKDFNALASLIVYERTNIAGDLNRDGKVDAQDVACLLDGYQAMTEEDAV